MRGRKKRTLLPVMQTQLWVNALKQLTNSSTYYVLDNTFEVLAGNHSADYASGKSAVSKKSLKLIDIDFSKMFGSAIKPSDFYNIGPVDSSGSYIPLWEAVGGPIDGLWDVLFSYDFSMELQHQLGLSFDTKISLLIARLFNRIEHIDELIHSSDTNYIADLYREKAIVVDLHLLTAVIAAWRLSHFMHESTVKLDYMMTGLLNQAVEDLLKPLGIYDTFVRYLIQLDQPMLLQFNKVIDSFNSLSPHKEDVGNFEHFRTKFTQFNISNFLASKSHS